MAGGFLLAGYQVVGYILFLMTDDERMVHKNEAASAGKILVATGAAVVVAVVILLAAVLPAEYGLDPFGTGETLGLLALAQVQPIAAEPGEYRLDAAELVVRPTEWVEYTYRLEEGGEHAVLVAGHR